MTDIYIRANTTTDDIRRQLSDFGWFSQVEARVEQKAQENFIVLHEVKLGERLRRFVLQSREQRDESLQKSRGALNALADRRPRLSELFGKSVQHKSVWTANELRKVLTSPLSQLGLDKTHKGLVVPAAENDQVGIANTKIADIVADAKVIWNLKPAEVTVAMKQRTVNEPQTYEELAVAVSSKPTPDEMRTAYRDALSNATGHVVLAPIQDIEVSGNIIIETQNGLHQGDIQCCSDESLTVLLEAIDEVKQKSTMLTAVTIATKEYVEKGLAGRIEDLQAARRLKAEESPMKSERGRFYPTHGRQAPGIAGIHFLTNSPFELQAGRTIVPLSLAQSKGYAYVKERDLTALPELDRGRLIAFGDRRIDQVKGGTPEDFGKRFSELLQNMAGTVVIYPPPLANEEQLQAMMSAVIDACKTNRLLSVSFATEDVNQRDALTEAYAAAKEARQGAQELDIDAEPEEAIINVAKLWKKA